MSWNLKHHRQQTHNDSVDTLGNYQNLQEQQNFQSTKLQYFHIIHRIQWIKSFAPIS